MGPLDEALARHYATGNLEASLLEALARAGKALDRLQPEDLAPVDHFHTRGYEATMELARLAALRPDEQVLDLGGGIGGPARTIARAFGVRVVVLDLTEEYCRTGASLTDRLGLAGRVAFRHGSALDLPFEDASFDVVWTQHSTMNIPDKPRLYREARRVLRPGGRLAMHEIMAGPVAGLHFPVPWARSEELSFLLPSEDVRRLIRRTGFAESVWQDESDAVAAWLGERLAQMQAPPGSGPPSPLGLALLLRDDFPRMFANVARNLAEGRLQVVHAVWTPH
jgi:ubiquinone/menaquinone biosynthesis C-methylase UbiE